jgi:hypothetical protein
VPSAPVGSSLERERENRGAQRAAAALPESKQKIQGKNVDDCGSFFLFVNSSTSGSLPRETPLPPDQRRAPRPFAANGLRSPRVQSKKGVGGGGKVRSFRDFFTLNRLRTSIHQPFQSTRWRFGFRWSPIKQVATEHSMGHFARRLCLATPGCLPLLYQVLLLLVLDIARRISFSFFLSSSDSFGSGRVIESRLWPRTQVQGTHTHTHTHS